MMRWPSMLAPKDAGRTSTLVLSACFLAFAMYQFGPRHPPNRTVGVVFLLAGLTLLFHDLGARFWEQRRAVAQLLAVTGPIFAAAAFGVSVYDVFLN